MLQLVVVVLAGVVILDVALDCWRQVDGVRRRRQLERDRVAMRRTLERTGGPRP